MKAVVLFALVIAQINCKEFQIAGIPTDRPLNIAHRGSSGMLPEHTVEAYRLAIDQGADVIECDVCLTKDLQMICMHDAWLTTATDIEDHEEYKDRKTTKFVGGRNRTDFFTNDFTLDEIKTLFVKQSRDGRDKSYDGMYRIPTLREYLATAQDYLATESKGVYPELKQPSYFNEFILQQEGAGSKKMEDRLLDVLMEFGYRDETQACFVQCFEIESLEYLRNRTKLPLIYLTGSRLSDDKLSEISQYAYGIGVSKNVIVQVGPDNHILRNTTFVQDCHDQGLKVHAYTFRNDQLPFDYGMDPNQEYQLFLKMGIDGYFTDFPASLNNFFRGVHCPEIPPPKNFCSITRANLYLFSQVLFAYFYLI